MVKHGALSKSHVHQMLASKDARVRRAAYTLLEASNPGLRRNSELFLEIIRFIWEANPSYDIYREFNKRHLIVPYKVHELISARLRVEKQEQQRAAADQVHQRSVEVGYALYRHVVLAFADFLRVRKCGGD